jgi:hypothetical protein
LSFNRGRIASLIRATACMAGAVGGVDFRKDRQIAKTSGKGALVFLLVEMLYAALLSFASRSLWIEFESFQHHW